MLKINNPIVSLVGFYDFNAKKFTVKLFCLPQSDTEINGNFLTKQ